MPIVTEVSYAGRKEWWGLDVTVQIHMDKNAHPPTQNVREQVEDTELPRVTQNYLPELPMWRSTTIPPS